MVKLGVGTGGELADGGDVADSIASDSPESFSWSSVILPCVLIFLIISIKEITWSRFVNSLCIIKESRRDP